MSKNSNMRTPLGRVRGLGAAREGTGHFWLSRVTGVALVALTLFMVGLLVSMNGAGYAEVRAVLANPIVSITVIVTLLTGLYHMWLGMQEIILDYAHAEATKYVMLMLNSFFSVVVGAACVFSLLKIAFGG
ncbi:MAG: succinate dehydrogenase, hydrophobic membrane anchor protein [Mesorhizobium sp.]